MKRIRITSQTGHFGVILGRAERETEETPPPSTVIGILRVLFGEEILEKEFKFGYTFKSELKYKDSITIYKQTNKGYLRREKEGVVITDCSSIENHYECELIIYTDLTEDLTMGYVLSMGKSGNPARVHLPIEEIELKDLEGVGYNQFTPKNIGKGVIKPTNMITRYNTGFNSFDAQIKHLRYNKEFKYTKNRDEELGHNIILWEYKDGEVNYFD